MADWPSIEIQVDGEWLTVGELVERERAELEAAAKAYRDLSTCYRLGRQPTEALFERLDRAKRVLEEES